MSRYFLYDTRFSELEQMMMLVPNFTSRKRGLIIMGNLESDAESIKDQLDYKALLQSSFFTLHNRYWNKRLRNLIKCWNGEWFLSGGHKQRFMSHHLPYSSKQLCAVIYLLSVDEDLWCRACKHISEDKINWSEMILRGINVDSYALYQTAKTIATGKEYIHINEIADEQLIGNFSFKAIIHGILIAKNGISVLGKI